MALHFLTECPGKIDGSSVRADIFVWRDRVLGVMMTPDFR